MSDNKEQTLNKNEAMQLMAIRDIIFGQNIEQYEKRFRDLDNNVLANKEAAATSLDNTKTELTLNLRKVEEQLNKNISKLAEQLTEQIQANHKEVLAAIAKLNDEKQDRRELGKLLIEIGNKISS